MKINNIITFLLVMVTTFAHGFKFCTQIRSLGLHSGQHVSEVAALRIGILRIRYMGIDSKAIIRKHPSNAITSADAQPRNWADLLREMKTGAPLAISPTISQQPWLWSFNRVKAFAAWTQTIELGFCLRRYFRTHLRYEAPDLFCISHVTISVGFGAPNASPAPRQFFLEALRALPWSTMIVASFSSRPKRCQLDHSTARSCEPHRLPSHGP